MKTFSLTIELQEDQDLPTVVDILDHIMWPLSGKAQLIFGQGGVKVGQWAIDTEDSADAEPSTEPVRTTASLVESDPTI